MAPSPSPGYTLLFMAKRARKTQKIPQQAPLSRWEAYRPALDRLIFIVALLGILTTVHLKIQSDRGFDRGCMGFTASEKVEATFNCEAVTKSASGQLLGVENAIWGLLFYLTVAGMSAWIVYTPEKKRPMARKARVALIVVGFAYSLYLSYLQYFVLEDLCALCLISAIIATVLFLLQAIDLLKPMDRKSFVMKTEKMTRELSLYGALAALVIVIAGADLAYFYSLPDPNEINMDQAFDEAPTPGAEADAQPLTVAQPAEDATRNTTADDHAASTGECIFDPEKDPVTNYAELATLRDPFVGPIDAPVTIIEYFDPNCPHCRTLHPVMKELQAKYSDTVRFVYKPVVVIGNPSVGPVAALHSAAQTGAFFQMLDLMFTENQGRGYSLAELRDYASRVGMDPNSMEQRIRGGIYSGTMTRQREEFANAGLTGVPAVLINGKVVANGSRTLECLSHFIEEEAGS